MRIPDYFEAGDGPVTIFLLHGGSGDQSYFAYDVALLVEAGYRVITWDAPGFGRSPILADYSIDNLADAGASLVDEVGSERNVIVAQSFGGIVAPAIVARTKRKVDALVLSSATASPANPAVADQIEKAPLPQGSVEERRAARTAHLMSAMAPGSSGREVDLVLEVASRTPSDAMLVKVIAAIRRYDGQPAARALNVPTLVLGGRHDPVATPEQVTTTAELIEDSELHIFENAGHFIFAEQPELYREILLDFIARNGGGTT